MSKTTSGIPTTVKQVPNLVKRLLIVSQPKVGKTHMLTKLPSNYIINFDNSLEHFGANGVDLIDWCMSENINPIAGLKRIAKHIADEKKANNGVGPYDYITIDTVTELEKHCETYAQIKYMRTTQGENFKGNILTDLEYGAGYLKLRDAVNEMLRLYWNLPNKCLILTGHLRESSVKARGTKVVAQDIGLTGKIKQIVSQKCDAIGTLYRDSENNNHNILSFITQSDDLITGARPQHLANSEFLISEMDEDGDLITHWEVIFPDLEN